MDIEALIKSLQALSDTLKSTAIREGESLNDFKNSVERFETVFSDLVVMSKSDVANFFISDKRNFKRTE